jgi:hypothetical protein
MSIRRYDREHEKKVNPAETTDEEKPTLGERPLRPTEGYSTEEQKGAAGISNRPPEKEEQEQEKLLREQEGLAPEEG